MICPRCKTENGNRTVCTKCSYYLYRPVNQNVESRSKAQRALDDSKIVGKNIWKILRVVWIVIVLVVMSFWLIFLLMWLTGGDIILG